MIKVLRVDDRLLHGQVAQNWVSYYNINKILIINNEVMHDEFSKMTLNLAKPKNVELLFLEVDHCARQLHEVYQNDDHVMVIVENFKDALRIHEILPTLHSINVGGLRHKADKDSLRLNGFVVLKKQDIDICKRLLSQGMKLEIRQIPAQKEQLIDLSEVDHEQD